MCYVFGFSAASDKNWVMMLQLVNVAYHRQYTNYKLCRPQGGPVGLLSVYRSERGQGCRLNAHRPADGAESGILMGRIFFQDAIFKIVMLFLDSAFFF